jgi:cytochrome c peroxidase
MSRRINFTTNAYHNLGVGTDKPDPDPGRFLVTKNEADWGAFKTPTLREIAKTAPYMHDGSIKTLEEVVEFYDKGGLPNKNLDKSVRKLNLSADEKKDLVMFLHALSGEGWQSIQEPTEYPQ